MKGDGKMAICKPKKGLQLLLKHEDYQGEVEVTVKHVWDIMGVRASSGVLVPNVHGSEDEVTRVAQEAFGFNTAHPVSVEWKLVPARTKIKAVNAVKVLEGLGIDSERILDDLEAQRKEEEEKKE